MTAPPCFLVLFELMFKTMAFFAVLLCDPMEDIFGLRLAFFATLVFDRVESSFGLGSAFLASLVWDRVKGIFDFSQVLSVICFC